MYLFACRCLAALFLSAFALGNPIFAGDSVCVASETRLCLGNNRFSVEVDFSNFAGNEFSLAAPGAEGPGRAVPWSEDTGFFWFLDQEDLSLVVKVLDGRNINGHFWFFLATTSNFEIEITLRDEQTGQTQVYLNAAGTNALFVPPVHLAQFGAGAGFSNRLSFANLSSERTASIELDLFSPEGSKNRDPSGWRFRT